MNAKDVEYATGIEERELSKIITEISQRFEIDKNNISLEDYIAILIEAHRRLFPGNELSTNSPIIQEKIMKYAYDLVIGYRFLLYKDN